jgi:hypothetical protein
MSKRSTTTEDIDCTTECSSPKQKIQRTCIANNNNNDDDDDDDDDDRNAITTITKDEKINQYKGWKVPKSNYQIPIIELSSTEGQEDEDDDDDDDDDITIKITPEIFYKDYIQHRRPVVIRGKKLPNELKKLDRWWTKTSSSSSSNSNSNSNSNNKNERIMIDRVGDELVMVEKRSNDIGSSFGKGNEISMTFRKFMELIEEGDNMHYLTTQDVSANNDGRPDLMSKFMKKLRQGGGNSNSNSNSDSNDNNTAADFPLRPKIAGNLIPQNINLWIGNSKDGTSSGLHHDYHDNFYVVLRGTKQFRLYSPADTEMMYTRGELLKVHPNGRINYKDEVTTAYGADIESYAAALAAKAKDDAEERLVKAEKGVEEGIPGAQEELELAEALLDKVMEDILDAETGSNVDDDDDDDDEEEEFHIENAKEGDADWAALNISDDEELMDNNNINNDDDDNNDSFRRDDDDDDDDDSCRIVDKTVKNPNNFSLVDQSILDNNERLKQDYPKFLEAKSAFCECRSGDILYLPASWFHEVKSFSSDGNNNNNNNNKGHMALNYWFHPPDANNNFEQPYSTDFWPNDFKNRLA